ncbi:hypothetical protein CEXT_578091 [Caerostris extrusa]|uniref:Uncharacterized protein n=1 Tax=Caerostris extrusa TaxID=172846 RepID=A0AAV4Y9Q1_CAEEX|nr:hypothetical protein CEXT_578091 [Caerostris extrusa]
MKRSFIRQISRRKCLRENSGLQTDCKTHAEESKNSPGKPDQRPPMGKRKGQLTFIETLRLDLEFPLRRESLPLRRESRRYISFPFQRLTQVAVDQLEIDYTGTNPKKSPHSIPRFTPIPFAHRNKNTEREIKRFKDSRMKRRSFAQISRRKCLRENSSLQTDCKHMRKKVKIVRESLINALLWEKERTAHIY